MGDEQGAMCSVLVAFLQMRVEAGNTSLGNKDARRTYIESDCRRFVKELEIYDL